MNALILKYGTYIHILLWKTITCDLKVIKIVFCLSPGSSQKHSRANQALENHVCVTLQVKGGRRGSQTE